MSKPLVIVLENEQPVSYNRILRMHWRARNEEAQRCKRLVALSLPPEVEVFEELVDIAIIAYYPSHRKDNCNIPAKFYIDGLLQRVIKDDHPLYVRSVVEISTRDKKRPRTEIRVQPVRGEAIHWEI